MTRRRVAVYACLAGLGWWRWHAQHRWHTPESVILHFGYDRHR